MVRMHDQRNSPEMFDDFSLQLQQPPELLFKRMPLALHWRQHRRPVHENPQLPIILFTLP